MLSSGRTSDNSALLFIQTTHHIICLNFNKLLHNFYTISSYMKWNSCVNRHYKLLIEKHLYFSPTSCVVVTLLPAECSRIDAMILLVFSKR
ncbi:hypothetical protein EMCRGX_G000290 [Ephydatia muelleri]